MKKLFFLISILISLILCASAIAVPAITINNTVVQGQNATSQGFHVTNDGGGVLNYIITSDQIWAIPGTVFGGTSIADENNLVSVNYNTTALAVGAYTAILTISDVTASNSPQTVQINISVTPKPTIGIQP